VSAPHPLAEALIKRLQLEPKHPVLDFAAGSGRNGEALRRAGFAVVTIDDATAGSPAPLERGAGPFGAVISTHGFLHGTAPAIAARLGAIADSLCRGGFLYATFGSTHDARFGRGERIDDATFAPADGDECGIAHAYFDRVRLRALLERFFEIESLDERAVDDVAGRWAHGERPLAGAVHWFALGRKR
jgi:hypothetical protein